MTAPSAAKPDDGRENPSATCGARTRAGTPCTQHAGWGTDHVGEGRCKLHGGKTPVKHGRYSKVTSSRLAERIAEFEGDPDPLNLEPEAAAIRALAADFMERYDEMAAALLAWNAAEAVEAQAEERKPRPARIPSIHEAAALFEGVSRVVEKIHKYRSTQAITLEQASRWFQALGEVVAKHVDPDTARRIEADWGAVLPSA